MKESRREPPDDSRNQFLESRNVTTGSHSVKSFLERKRLLASARRAVASRLLSGETPLHEVTAEDIADRRGAFVTLHIDGALRGCVGVLSSSLPLVDTVIAMSLGASLEDSRFEPLTLEELTCVTFEISLISPAVDVASIDQIVTGRDGVVVSSGGRRALLLPQVAVQIGGGVSDFLEAACRKAGLSSGAWRLPGTRIQTFTAEVFAEEP